MDNSTKKTKYKDQSSMLGGGIFALFIPILTALLSVLFYNNAIISFCMYLLSWIFTGYFIIVGLVIISMNNNRRFGIGMVLFSFISVILLLALITNYI